MAEGQAVDSNLATVEAPITGQADSVSTGTVETTNGQATAGQSAPAEEQFSNIDPKTLPPELQAVYKNLQSDYTKKTQSVAESRKKAEMFDKLNQDPRVSDFLKGLNSQQRAEYREQKEEMEKRLGEKIPDDRFEEAFKTKDGFLDLIAEVVKETSAKDRKEVETLKQFKMVTEASNIVESFATEQGSDGKPLRPDFYSLDEDGLINGYLKLSAPQNGYTSEAYKEALDQAYNWSKTLSSKYYEKGKSDAMARIQQKVAASSNPPTQAAKGAYTGPDPKKLTVRESMDLAKKGIKVPQVYD